MSESRGLPLCQFVFLGLSVLDLGPMYVTDRRQASDVHHRLMPSPRHNKLEVSICKLNAQILSSWIHDLCATLTFVPLIDCFNSITDILSQMLLQFINSTKVFMVDPVLHFSPNFVVNWCGFISGLLGGHTTDRMNAGVSHSRISTASQCAVLLEDKQPARDFTYMGQ